MTPQLFKVCKLGFWTPQLFDTNNRGVGTSQLFEALKHGSIVLVTPQLFKSWKHGVGHLSCLKVGSMVMGQQRKCGDGAPW